MAEKESKKVTANRTYKDTVFRKLFSDRKNLLSLYNAINGTAYTDETELEIVTLESAIYMEMKNDLAFIIDTNLFLYEHQSTYNPNMPLRDLFYISSEYQKLVDKKSLYSTVLLKIPAPHFIVFYNGRQKMPDRWTNCLSEAYENQQGEPDLELKVVTININDGHNEELMEQCKILGEYAQYVERVRKNAEAMSLDVAVQNAVDECIQKGILEDFLRANRAEVIAMSIFEYDKEEEEQKLQKTYEAIGEKRGIKIGERIGEKRGIIIGEKKKAKDIAISLRQAGDSIDKIARTVGEKEETIREWTGEKD